MSDKLKQIIKTIECFDKESQFYWISKLNICDSEKGYLIIYFNLNK